MTFLENAAFDLGLSYDKEVDCLYGLYKGYQLAVLPTAQHKQFQILLSVSRQGDLPTFQDMKELRKSSKLLKTVDTRNYKVSCFTKPALSKEKTKENIAQTLQIITDFLARHNYHSCDELDGQVGDVHIYLLAGSLSFLKPENFSRLSSELDRDSQAEQHIKEQLLPGLVGAFLGSLLGVLAIVIISQLGYISVVSGIIMGLATIKGYEILGKRLTVRSAVLCLIIMLLMTYFAIQIDVAMSISRAFGLGFFDTLIAIPDLLAVSYLDSSSYYINLILIYAFSILGFLPTVLTSLKVKNMQYDTRQLS